MKAHFRTGFDSALAPERVVATLIDFSEQRPQIWPSLDPAKYHVHEVGDTWAVVTEGNRRPNIWARERYDYSVPGRVSWQAEESNFCTPGSGVDVVVTPRPADGSHVELYWHRTSTTPTGAMIVVMMAIVGKRQLAASFKGVFDRVALSRE